MPLTQAGRAWFADRMKGATPTPNDYFSNANMWYKTTAAAAPSNAGVTKLATATKPAQAFRIVAQSATTAGFNAFIIRLGSATTDIATLSGSELTPAPVAQARGDIQTITVTWAVSSNLLSNSYDDSKFNQASVFQEGTGQPNIRPRLTRAAIQTAVNTAVFNATWASGASPASFAHARLKLFKITMIPNENEGDDDLDGTVTVTVGPALDVDSSGDVPTGSPPPAGTSNVVPMTVTLTTYGLSFDCDFPGNPQSTGGASIPLLGRRWAIVEADDASSFPHPVRITASEFDMHIPEAGEDVRTGFDMTFNTVANRVG